MTSSVEYAFAAAVAAGATRSARRVRRRRRRRSVVIRSAWPADLDPDRRLGPVVRRRRRGDAELREPVGGRQQQQRRAPVVDVRARPAPQGRCPRPVGL